MATLRSYGQSAFRCKEHRSWTPPGAIGDAWLEIARVPGVGWRCTGERLEIDSSWLEIRWRWGRNATFWKHGAYQVFALKANCGLSWNLRFGCFVPNWSYLLLRSCTGGGIAGAGVVYAR